MRAIRSGWLYWCANPGIARYLVSMIMHVALKETVVWVLLERGLQVLMVLLLNGLLARYLGPDGFGVLHSLLSVANACAAIGLMCSAEVLLPRYAASATTYKDIFQHAFYIRTVFSLIASVIYAFIIFVHYSDHPVLALFLLPIVLLNEAFASFAVYFQSVGKQKILSTLRLCGLALKLVIAVGFMAVAVPLEYLGISYAVESVVVSILLVVLFKRARGVILAPLNHRLAIELVKNGAVIGFGLIAMVVMQKADRLYLALYGDPHEMGLYSAAAQIAENWFMVGTLITQAVSARFIYSLADADANKNIMRLMMALAGAALGVAAVGQLLAVPVVTIIYGDGFEGAAASLVWLLLTGFFVFSDIALSTRMLKDRNSSLFVLKWIVSLLIVLMVAVSMRAGWINTNALLFPLAGYGTAFIISLIYYLRSRNHENSNSL